MRLYSTTVKFFLPFLFFAAALRAQDAPSFDYRPATVVVYNAKDPASTELANYYAKQRGISEKNLVGLKCSTSEMISRQQFINEIENPLRAEFDARKWWETRRVPKEGLLAVKTIMRVLVIIQGVPMRIMESPHGKDPKTGQDIPANPGDQNAAAVDSELVALGVLEKPIAGRTPNPYFNSVAEFAKVAFTPMFIVGRLDGPDKTVVKRMIDDAIAVEKTGLYGKAYVDLARKTGNGYDLGEKWLINAARTLQTKGVPVVLDTWAPTLPVNYPLRDCAFYLGWYADHADGPFLNPAFRFRPGAVAVHIHSFSAANVKSPKTNWCGPLLSKGACATLGNVFEPYLPFTASLDVFTDRLLNGFTLGEAAWMSTPVLSWMNVVVGDPLYRPFAALPGSGDKKISAEYKAIRLAMTRWGKPEQLADLNANLTLAAENLKSADIYEFLALRAQANEGKSWPKAEKWFRLAEKMAVDPADNIHLQFLMADALRRDGDTKQAAKMLNAIAEKYPAAPEVTTVKALVQQMK
jgi:uncharacterized protein (TIGR03790 family)